MQTLTIKNFEGRKLLMSGTVLADFWGAWCAPCRALEPDLKKLETLFSTLVIGKVDSDTQQGVLVAFEIRGLPTLIVFRDGVEVARMMGVGRFDKLKRFVEPHLTTVA